MNAASVALAERPAMAANPTRARTPHRQLMPECVTVPGGQTLTIHLPRVERVPGALWQPRRWVLLPSGPLPCLYDEADLEAWLRAADPGAVVAYHHGRSLEGRMQDRRLDLLARAVLLRSRSADQPNYSPCGHQRGTVVCSGELELVQRRDSGRFVYLARRL